MPLTALLIGSDHGGLTGVRNDLRVMRKALEQRGFRPLVCGPEDATRAGILAAYEELIAGAGPDDAIVVYYTGHGGQVGPSDPAGYGAAPRGPAELQYIVPVDYCKSNEHDFRGIAAAELSVLQARLTAVTSNVTVILDCCHSGLMSRDAGLRVKAVEPAPYEWVRAHLDRLEHNGLRTDLVPNEGNHHAVRIVACAPEQRAYEYQGAHGQIGVLTESLALALAEAGNEPVTWADLMERVRHRVLGRCIGQRPEAEGPASRLLFSTEEAELLHSLPVTPLEPSDRVSLDCAPLLRVQDGDEFAIMPPGKTRLDTDDRIGDLTIDTVSAMSAAGKVTFAPGRSRIPVGARAFRTKVTAPRLPVRFPADDPRAGRVIEELRTTALARPVGPDDDDWTAEVRIDPNGGLTLCDRIGPLHPPYPSDARGLADLAKAVRIFTQAVELRRLVGDPTCPLDADVNVEWGLVENGVTRPLAFEGEVLSTGQRIYVTVRNDGQTPVYVSLLDIGVSGRIQLAFRGTPSGRQLRPGHRVTLGYHEITQALPGVALSWPPRLDPACARPETILVVLSSEPQNLLALEQPEIAQTRSAKGARSRLGDILQNIVDQLATGQTRDLEPDWSTDVRYDLRAIDFDMAPAQADLPAVK